MASPPASSPPSGSLALPRQRPTINTGGLALPTNPPNPRRKPSTASATSSSHPLRQTSFPPPEGQSALYSPEGSADFSDSEINGAIAGSDVGGSEVGGGAGKKRKRGEKRMRGRPPKNPQAAAAARAGSAVNDKGAAEGGAEGEDDDEDEDVDTADARDDIALRLAEESLHQNELLLQMNDEQLERHAIYKRSKLRTQDVRRLINQTVSQSVPANVVTVVGAYTKMFAGLLIEGAREVQSEWMAVEEKRADGQTNHVAKKVGMMDGDASGSTTQASSSTAAQPNGHAASDDTQPNTDDGSATLPGTDDSGVRPVSPSQNIRRELSDHDRGPLTPDHLREALRRYKKSRYGGTVGFTGLSLEGKDVAAARVGGKRLFR